MVNDYHKYDKERTISIIIIVVSVLLFIIAAIYFLFIKKDNITDASEKMPEIVGYSITDVEGCYSRFFTLEVIEETYSDYAEGVILSQSIEADKKYDPGNTVVKVTISAGPKPVETTTVPVTEAITAITEPEMQLETGLFVDVPSFEFESTVPEIAAAIHTIGIDKENENIAAALDELYSILIKRYGEAGFMYVDLETGASIEYNADAMFSSASIIKAPYVRAVLGQENMLDTEYEMTEELLNTPSELVNGEPVGTKFSVSQLAEATISKSDNTAYKMLYHYIGYDCFNQLSDSLNLNNHMTDENYWFKLSARETAIYFKDIYCFNEQHQNGQFMKEYLDKSDSNEMFGYELKEYTVCEKYGYLPQPQEDFYTLGDAAIVYAESPYILVGYVRGKASSPLNTQIFRDTGRCADKIHRLIHSEDN